MPLETKIAVTDCTHYPGEKEKSRATRNQINNTSHILFEFDFVVSLYHYFVIVPTIRDTGFSRIRFFFFALRHVTATLKWVLHANSERFHFCSPFTLILHVVLYAFSFIRCVFTSFCLQHLSSLYICTVSDSIGKIVCGFSWKKKKKNGKNERKREKNISSFMHSHIYSDKISLSLFFFIDVKLYFINENSKNNSNKKS